MKTKLCPILGIYFAWLHYLNHLYAKITVNGSLGRLKAHENGHLTILLVQGAASNSLDQTTILKDVHFRGLWIFLTNKIQIKKGGIKKLSLI